MNRIYSLVWNRTLGIVQVTSELARPQGGGSPARRNSPTLSRNALVLACAVALGSLPLGSALGAAPGRVTLPGVLIVNGDISASTPDIALGISAVDDITLNGVITTAGPQTYDDAVLLGSDVTLNTTDSAVDFMSTVDNAGTTAENLTVNAGTGAVTFGGAVGSGANGALGALTVSGTGATSFDTVNAASLATNMGTTTLGGNVTTTGTQTYNGAVLLGSDVTLDTTDSAVDFTSTVDNAGAAAENLAVNAGTGAVTFGGAVGSGANGALGALTVSGSGATSFDTVNAASLATNMGTTTLGGNVTTAGTQTYNGAVALGANVILTTADSSVTFAGAVTNATVGTPEGLRVNAGSGAVSFDSAVGSASDPLGTLEIDRAGNAMFAGTVDVAGSLSLATMGPITQAAAWSVGGASSFDAGDNAITLDNGSNNFAGAVSLSNGGANDVTLNNGNHTLELGNVSVGSGALSLIGAGITQTGAIVQAAGAGTASLNAGSGAIVLENAGNDFSGSVTAGGAGIRIFDVNDLTLATLDDHSNGDVSLSAGGTLTLPTGGVDAGAGSLALASHGGTLTTGGALSGGNVTLTGASGITLGGNVVASGSLSLTSANAAIGQTAGVLSVAGTTSVDAGAGSVTLTSVGNDFGGNVSITAGDVSLTDRNALGLGTLHTTGLLAVTSMGVLNLGSGIIGGSLTAASNGGAITQGGGLTVAGAASVDAGANAITLGATGNDFQGPISLSNSGASNVTLDNGNHALALGDVNVGSGALSLGGGGITQTGGVVQAAGAGDVVLDAGTGAVVLENAGNDFTGAVTASGVGIGIFDANDLTLAGVTDSDNGDVTVMAGGTLTLSGSGIDAGSGNLTLASNGGMLATSGALSGGNVSLTGTDGVVLDDDVTSAGTLVLDSSSGDIAQVAGALATTTLTGSAAGNVALTSGGNLFADLGNFTANGFSLTNAQALHVTGSVDGGSGTTSIYTLTGDLDLASAGSIAGGSIALGTAGGMQLDGAITSSGDVSLSAGGNMVLDGTLTATSTEVQAGSLIVGSVTGNGAQIDGNVAVGAGATLGGHGNVTGTVSVAAGGVLSPGNSIGTLTLGGMNLASGSVLDFELGAPAVGNPFTTAGASDHVTVTGTLTFNGSSTLNLADVGGMGPGLYNLFDYGTLAMNGCAIGSGRACLQFGNLPAGVDASGLTVVNNTAGRQIDLYNTAGLTLNIWAPNGTVNPGGTGTWTATSPTWTDPAGDGPAAMNPQPGFAIFQGTPGTVTLDASAGNVSATGLQFAVDGYALTGAALTLVGTSSGGTTTAPIITVGDGSGASAGMTATISAGLAGVNGFTKTGAGTLALTSPFSAGGLNGLAGTVSVQAGTLQLGTSQAQSLNDVVVLRAPVTMAAGSKLVLASGVVDPYSSGMAPAAPVGAAVSGQGFDITTSTTGTGTVSAIIGNIPVGASPGAYAGSAIAGTGFSATFTGNTFVAGNLAPAGSQAVGAAAITGSGFQVTNANASGTYNGVLLGISGGAGAYSASGAAGTGGAGIAGSGFTVTNSGDIYGGMGGGTNSGTAGLGGAGVFSTGGATVINEGTISGGMSGDGATQADAIDFTGGGNTLELVAGYAATFNGAISVVRAAGDAADTLELGGDTGSDTFDVGQLADGGMFGGFNADVKSGASTWTLTGMGTDAQNWTVEGGTLQGDASALQGDIAFAPASGATATVVFDQGSGNANSTPDATYAGVISGDGSLVKNGDGVLTLAGDSTFSGGTAINAGTLQVGAGGTTGAIGTGDVADNGTLAFDRSDAVTFAGAMSGTGTLLQQGAGSLALDGDSSAFAGSSTVQAGTLIIGSAVGNGAALGGNITVDSGATLGGHGTIGGDIDVAGGAHVAPGNSIGTLTIDGNATFAAGSALDVELGAPGANLQTAGVGDSVKVGGVLSLAGTTLNVTDAGGMGPGLYNLFTYGSLTASGCTQDATGAAGGCLVFGATPQGAQLVIQYLASGSQINLFDATGMTLNVWNANGTASPTQMGGGSGTWSATSPEWTDATGTAPNSALQPQPGFAIFGGTPGTVTVDDGAGLVSAAGMQFAVDGYTLTGDTLTLVSPGGSGGANTAVANPVIRVGDGSANGTAMTATIDNVLAGNAGLAKTDLGTLVLAGANTFTGGVAINGGTLSVSSDANLGDAGNAVDIFDSTLQNTAAFTTARSVSIAGTATLRTDADLTLAGGISGIGALTKEGSGTLVLTNANAFDGGTTIGAGTLQIGNGGATGSITGDVTDLGVLAFDRSDDVTFAGVISGSGTLVQQGSGSLILNAASPFGGATTVRSGTLIVGDDGHADASLAGAVDVAAGATLGGFGTVGSVDVAGTLSPGHSIGTFHVAGDATFEAGSTFEVEAAADGSADLLAVGGKATIKGGNTLVLAQAGNWAPQTAYTILTAGGGVSGSFAGVSDNFAFLDPALSYAANAVALTLVRNNVDFQTLATTPNERNTAVVENGLGFGNMLYDALVKLDVATAPTAFNQTSGEANASQQAARIDDSRYVREAMNQRLREGDADAEASHGTRVTAWAHGWGHWGSIDGDGNAADISDNGDGLLVGADMPAGATGRVGVTGGASRNTLSVRDRDSWGKLTAQWLGVYGGFVQGPFALRAGIAHAREQIPGNRAVAFPAFSDRLSSNASGDTTTAYVEGAWQFTFASGSVAPYLNLANVRVHTDSATEAGGAAALHSTSQDMDTSLGTLGARGDWQLADHVSLRADLGWQHAFGDITPERTQWFASGSDAFTVYGAPLARNAAVARLGVDWQLAPNVRISAGYAGLLGGGVTDHAAKAGINVAF